MSLILVYLLSITISIYTFGFITSVKLLSAFIIPPAFWYLWIVTPLGRIFLGKNKRFLQKQIKIDESIKLSKHENYSNHISRKNLPDGEFDHVVIGSGMGALSAARLLVQAGKRVLILEAHDRIGGQMHVFRDSPTESCPQGVEFDVGLHYGCGGYECGPEATLISTFDHFLTESEWTGLDDSFDRICLADPETGKKVAEYSTTKTAKNRWNNFLSECKKMSPGTINKDIQAMYKLQTLEQKVRSASYSTMFKLLPMFLIKWLSKIPFAMTFLSGHADDWGCTQDMLDYVKCSDAFKFLYAYAWGDLGVPPHRSSFRMHSGLIKEYSKGAAYPVGGCIPMVNRMLVKIMSVENSRAFTNAKVVQIIVEDGKVTERVYYLF